MNEQRPSARLSLHSIRYRMNGFPIYGRGQDFDGDDEDEIKGVVVEPEWKWSDLTPEEQAHIKQKAADLRAESARRIPDDPLSDDSAIGFMLGEYGVGCFHRWRYMKDSRDVPFAKDCTICLASEQLPGKPYRVGDQWMRLDDPPPRTIRVALPPSSPSFYMADDRNPSVVGPAIEVAEYRSNGRGYERSA